MQSLVSSSKIANLQERKNLFRGISTNQLTFFDLKLFITGPVVGVMVTEGVIDKFDDRPSSTLP